VQPISPVLVVHVTNLTPPGSECNPTNGPNKVAKKKIWEKVQPGLATTAACAASWCGTPLVSTAGPVVCATVKGGGIS
jgi:hypothetical protein